MRIRPLTIVSAILFATTLALADEEASNHLYVVSATWGTHYAKCIPAEATGSKGQTQIFLVTKDNDVLEHTFDWFAPQIWLQGTSRGCSVVRQGPWPRGHAASKDDLAIAFYLDGKLLKQYSTLDLAVQPDNVLSTKSHYTIFEKVIGYRWIKENDYAFDVSEPGGKIISFNVFTGEIIPPEPKEK